MPSAVDGFAGIWSAIIAVSILIKPHRGGVRSVWVEALVEAIAAGFLTFSGFLFGWWAK